MVYRNALALPLQYGFNISTKDKAFNLLARSQFIKKPPIKRNPPRWCLLKVLRLLSSPSYCQNPTAQQLFYKALFLTAMAAANRSSELAALHRPSVAFSSHFKKVTLPVLPGFLYKNQRPNRALPNITIKALSGNDNKPHPLCPVAALRKWLKTSSETSSDRVFVDPKSGKPLNAGRISFNLSSH